MHSSAFLDNWGEHWACLLMDMDGIAGSLLHGLGLELSIGMDGIDCLGRLIDGLDLFALACIANLSGLRGIALKTGLVGPRRGRAL